MIWILLLSIVVLLISTGCFLSQSSFGKAPSGERLERIKQSPHYENGKFHNATPTEVLASNRSKVGSLIDFVFRKVDGLTPDSDVPVIKTDLMNLSEKQDVLVWLGHSSCYVQLDGVRFLIDPVLISASPVSFVNKPFKGTSAYLPEDLPDIDYLIISHDHWDHLDYETVTRLKERIGKVICPLGVGEHFEYWGYEKDQIIELDWNESTDIAPKYVIHCLPARHFSGRSLKADQTLWASFMITSPSFNLYISGDTGYDSHFSEIASKFKKIDFALLENGQYNEDWKSIHLLPDDLGKAVMELKPAHFMTVHNSKYALGMHPWYEPLEKISEYSAKNSLPLLTPKIGEPIYLKSPQKTGKWWE